jgi:RES domain-containing protein
MPPSPGLRPRPRFIALDEIAYRITSYDVPFWVNPNRRSGRWNIAGGLPTQYMALDAEAPFAEILRHEDLITVEAASHYRSTVWQMRIISEMVVDYSSFELADTAGFDADALVSDDHERCQGEAQWLYDQGARGVLSPSAALPGSINLTLFGPRVAVAWEASIALASSVPAQKVATGNPPRGLTERARFVGQPHSALQAYLAEVRRDA